jgi:hypothetical protein
MFHEIQNPKLDSLVHCFKVPDLATVFGDVSNDNVNDVFSLFDLEELFSRPQDHGAFIFYVDKDKTEDLFNELVEQDFIESITEAGENGLVAVYHGEKKDLVILLETNAGVTSKAYLSQHNGFGHKFYYFEEFFVTIEMFSGEDNSFLVGLGNNVELFEFFCKLDVYKD